MPDLRVRPVDARGAAFGAPVDLGPSTGRVSVASLGDGALVAWKAETEERAVPRLVAVGMAGDVEPVPLPPLSHDGVALDFPPRLHGDDGVLIAWWPGADETLVSRCDLARRPLRASTPPSSSRSP